MSEPRVARPGAIWRRWLPLAVVAACAAALVSCSQGGSGASGSRTSPAGSLALPTTVARSSLGGAGATSQTSSAPAPSTSRGSSAAGGATSEPGSATSVPATTTSTRTATTTTTRTETTTGTTTRTETTTTTTTTAAGGPSSAATTTATAQATTPAATPATSTAEAQSTGGVPWWAWLLLLLVVAGLVAAIPLLTRRRRRELDAWDGPLADAEASAQWLHDRFLPAAVDADDPAQAGASWSLVRPRFLELDEQLTGLLRSAPDAERRAVAASLRVALADLASALDGRSRAGSAGDDVTARLRVELARDRLERRLAHEPLVPAGSAP